MNNLQIEILWEVFNQLEYKNQISLYRTCRKMYKGYKELNKRKNIKIKWKIQKEIEKEQEEKLRKIIEKYKRICAISNTKLGKTGVVKYRINTGNHKPIKQRTYKTNEKQKEMIKEEVTKMLKAGII